MAPRTRRKEHPDNRAADGYPLGLEVPMDQLDAATINAIARRHNLWTRPKMRGFLEALSQTCSVSDAAAAVGMSRQAAYRLRTRLSGQPFDAAWEAALEFSLQQLTHAALDRAMNGVSEPIFRGGAQVGTRTRFNERLTIFLLANPGRVGRNPLGREMMLKEWEDVMDLIEHGPLTWEEMEAAAPSSLRRKIAKKTAAEVSAFADTQSHYVAKAREEDAARRPLPRPHDAQNRNNWSR